MRLQSLLALVATSALLLPLGAHAAEWSATKKAEYMTQCSDTTKAQGFSDAAAKQYCQCGANAIKKNFTDAEIEDLDSKDGVNAALMKRAQKVITEACPLKK
mgnify:CR=1 FL=1